MLKNYLSRLRKEGALDELITESSPNQWEFFIEEHLKADLQQQEDWITFLSHLGPAPASEQGLDQLLSANLALRNTLGSVLGLDPQAQTTLLRHQVPLDAGYTAFREELESFVDVAYHWSYVVRGERPPAT